MSKVCEEIQTREQLLLEAMVVVEWCDYCASLELNLMDNKDVHIRVSHGMTTLGNGIH